MKRLIVPYPLCLYLEELRAQVAPVELKGFALGADRDYPYTFRDHMARVQWCRKEILVRKFCPTPPGTMLFAAVPWARLSKGPPEVFNAASLALHYNLRIFGVAGEPAWLQAKSMPEYLTPAIFRVVDVDVCLVKDITVATAIKCGVRSWPEEGHWMGSEHPTKHTPKTFNDPVTALRSYLPEGTEWVWVKELERVR